MAKKTRRTKLSSKSPAKGPGRPRKAAAPKANTLSGRLRAVAGDATFQEVGKKTGSHPENARRYLSGGSVGLKFLKSFCNAYKVRADWLLEGTGEQRRSA